MRLNQEPYFKSGSHRLLVLLFSISGLLLAYNYWQLQFGPNPSALTGKILLGDVIISAVGFLAMLLLHHHFLRGILQKLTAISTNIDRLMEADFFGYLGIEAHNEGILSRLDNQMGQLARRIQLQLQLLNEEKDSIKTLVTDISHQIKTPLAAIKMFNSLLQEEELSEAERQEFLLKNDEEITRLQQLSEALIKLSRLEAGMMKCQVEAHPIKSTILEAVNGVYWLASVKNIHIKLTDIQDLLIVHDTRWTKEALFNIMENAVKYTPSSGEIEVKMDRLETYLRIDIIDNGIGIEDEEISLIFTRFYRGKSPLVAANEGSGVGLYLARKILQEQGGNIIADSQLGIGSKLSIFLPYKTVI